MQLLVVSSSKKPNSWFVSDSCDSGNSPVAVCQQFRDSVCRLFEWFSSISLSALVRLQFMVNAGRLVHHVVQLLVQLVR